MGCLTAETGLRITGYSYPYFYTTDYYRGYSPRPNGEGWFWVENKNYLRINSDGLRDWEHSKKKASGTLRIAVLGDSFVEAREVPLEDAFWFVMKENLRQCPALAGRSLEVVNFGVAGYGTAQELVTLREKVWDYSPDIVLLAVMPYNDIIDNYHPLRRTPDVPYFIYRDGKLVYDVSFRDSSKYRWHDSYLFRIWIWTHNHSRLIQLVHHVQESVRRTISTWKEQRRLSQIKNARDPAQSATPPERTALAQEVGINNLVYLEPVDKDWQEAWRVTEGLVLQVRDEVKARRVGFMVVTVSTDIQVHPDTATRQAFMQRLGVNNLLYPNLRLQSLAEREGIPFLDLAQPMHAYAEQNRVFLHGFGKNFGGAHWNPTGHWFAGQLIARRLCDQLSK